MAMIDRQRAEALIQTQVAKTILQGEAQTSSVLMQLATRLPNMTSHQTEIPVLNSLPMAYWVNGDTGRKRTSDVSWDKVYLRAEELAVIVPIPEAVVEDAGYDIVGQTMPRVYEAIWRAVDEAAIFGVNKPRLWGNSIIEDAKLAGQNVVGPSNGKDIYDLLMGENGVIAKVEENGFMSNGAVASMGMRAKLRGLRTTTGAPIFTDTLQGATRYALDGEPLFFPGNGSFHQEIAQLIVGDWKQAVYAIRTDIQVKILDQAVLQNPETGAIEYNLPQQDMIALRVRFRMGFALPHIIRGTNTGRIGSAFAFLDAKARADTEQMLISVTDASSTPIVGARISLGGVDRLTNNLGFAGYDNLQTGKTYEASVSMAGYVPMRETITVSKTEHVIVMTPTDAQTPML